MRQLTFDLGCGPSYDDDDFLESPSNEVAYRAILSWPDWVTSTQVLIGPPGSGKSHLSTIWARHADACRIRTQAELAARLSASASATLVEDCDRADYSEENLFHLINMVKEEGDWLLMTARAVPNLWGLATQDLLSRLRLARWLEIGPPDPALIRAVIVKLFADRQIAIGEGVVTYAGLNCEQSFEAVSRFVDAVDEASLSSGRRITKPLAAITLARLADEDQGPT